MDAEFVKDTNLIDANVIIRKLSEKITDLTIQNAILSAQLEKALLSPLKN
jgi:hypothetical protein